MIKIEHVGMFDRAVVNPMLTAQTATANYTIINDANGDAYLVINRLAGDNAYKDEMVVPAGEFLNGYLLKSLKGQSLVIEGKHIDGGIENAEVGDILIVNEDGAFEIGETTGESLYLVITDVDARLAEKAVKAKIVVAPVAEEENGGGSNADPVVNTVSPTTATFDMNTSGVNYGSKTFTVTPATTGATIDRVTIFGDTEYPSEYDGITFWKLDETGLAITFTTDSLADVGGDVVESDTPTMPIILTLTDDSTVDVSIVFEDTTPVSPGALPENTVSPTSAMFDLNASGANYGDKVFTVTPAASGATIDKLLDDEGDETPSEVQETTMWSVGASGLVLTLTKEYLSAIGAAVISAGGTYDMTIKLTDDSTVAITIMFEDTT